MKYIKSLLILIILSIRFSTVKVAAATLTITDKSYNKNTNVFTVGGETGYNEVMVSVFDENDQLISFRTVSKSGNTYNANFYIVFNENKTVTIKVGDINSDNYEIATLDVEKSKNPFITKIEDSANNSLEILDSLTHFKSGDNLDIEIIDDFDSLPAQYQELVNAIKEKLGPTKVVLGIMDLKVVNNTIDREFSDIENGYKLILNIPKEALESLTKPSATRILDLDKLTFEDPKLFSYDEDAGGYALSLNNIGIYVLYDDITKVYPFIKNTDSLIYNKTLGADLTWVVDADFSKFEEVYIDEIAVAKANRTVKSGSTIITISGSYLKTLKAGSHTIYAKFTDGYAQTTFNVKEDSIIKDVIESATEVSTDAIIPASSNPNTSDNIYKYVGMFIGAGCILAACIVINKKRKN